MELEKDELNKFIIPLYEASLLGRSLFMELCTEYNDYSSLYRTPQSLQAMIGSGKSYAHSMHSMHTMFAINYGSGGFNTVSWSSFPKIYSRVFVRKMCDSNTLNLSKPKKLKEGEVFEIEDFPNSCSISNFIQHTIKAEESKISSIEIQTFVDDDECERYISLKNAGL